MILAICVFFKQVHTLTQGRVHAPYATFDGAIGGIIEKLGALMCNVSFFHGLHFWMIYQYKAFPPAIMPTECSFLLRPR